MWTRGVKAGLASAACLAVVVMPACGNSGGAGPPSPDPGGGDPGRPGGNGNGNDNGSGNGGVGAPINIPSFTITGNPLEDTISSVTREFDEVCGDEGPGCLVLEFDVRPPQTHPTRSSCDTPSTRPAAGTTVTSGDTVTVILNCTDLPQVEPDEQGDEPPEEITDQDNTP
jgi:hypothetical protein